MTATSTSTNAPDQYVRFTRGASYLILQNLGLNAMAILSFAILARLISPEEMGIWTVLTLVNAACLTFATWFPSSVTKFVAENIASGSQSTAAACFYKALCVNIVIYAAVVVGIYIGSGFLSLRLLGTVTYAPLFRVLALDVFFYGGLMPIAWAALLGLQMFREIAIVGLTLGGFLRQSLIIMAIILMKNFLGLILGWLISDAALALIYLAYVLRALGPPKLNFPVTKLLRFYLPIELAQILTFVQIWFDRIFLLLYVPLAILGIYNVALTAFGVLVGISGAMGSMLFPAYSSIKSIDSLRNAIRLATRYASFVLIPLAFGLIATARPSLTLFAGNAYITGYLPLIMLSGAFAATAFATALSPVFLAIEETKTTSLITGITVIVGLAAAYVLIPGWGIVGASTARALTTILAAILTLAVLARKITLRLDLRAIVKTMIAGAAMALTIAGVESVEYSKVMLPLYIVIGAIVYLPILRFLRVVDPDDLILVSRLLGRRLLPISRILAWMLISRKSTIISEHGSNL